MGERERARKFVIAGAVAGALLSITIAILMDALFADAFQGTWRDAIAKDLNSLFSLGLTSSSFLVYVVFVLVLALLAAFGGLLGFVFSFFLYKFFSFLTDK